MIEYFKDFDIFSEPIQFNSSRQRLRKRTLLGAFLTTSIIILTSIYFIYQSYLYFNGKMDPKFRQQTFVSSQVNIKLNNEMFGFDFFSLYSEQSYLSEIQAKQNKTYIVFVPAFIFRNSTTSFRIHLDIIKCQNPDLKGMNCIDLSKIPHQLLSLDNANKLYSLITLYVYRCQDTDSYKTFVPDNCADEQSINDFINKSPYHLNIKIQTSQYNITSYQMKTQYRSQVFQTSQNIVSGYEFKMQSQVTEVNQGILIQSSQVYSSLISYQLTTQTFDREQIIKDTGADESMIYINIQYPLFTEILALCNSTLALLLILGSFGRKMAQNLIRRDIIFILLRNFFSQTYLNILKHNNLIQTQNTTKENQQLINEEQAKQNFSEVEETRPNVLPPSQSPKPSEKVFRLILGKDNKEECSQDYIKQDNLIYLSQRSKKAEYSQLKIQRETSIYESPLSLDSQNEKCQEVSIFKTYQNSQKTPLKLEECETAQNIESQQEKCQLSSPQRISAIYQTLSFSAKGSSDKLLKDKIILNKLLQKSNKQELLKKAQCQQRELKSYFTEQKDDRLESLNNLKLQHKVEKIIFSKKQQI